MDDKETERLRNLTLYKLYMTDEEINSPQTFIASILALLLLLVLIYVLSV